MMWFGNWLTSGSENCLADHEKISNIDATRAPNSSQRIACRLEGILFAGHGFVSYDII
jgi:hypothetical protein